MRRIGILLLALLLCGCAGPQTGMHIYDTAEVKTAGEGSDLFRLYSAYPVGEGEPSHSLMLSWERGGEPIAAIPALTGLAIPIGPEIREAIQTDDGIYLLLSYQEPFTGRENFGLYLASVEALESIYYTPYEEMQLASVPLPDFGELLFAPERMQPAGQSPLAWITSAFGEAGQSKQLRIGWRGPHTIEYGEDGLRCEAVCYLLDQLANVYVELETALTLSEGE